MIKDIIFFFKYYFYYFSSYLNSKKKNYYRSENDPIFIISCNRSGTNLLSSILYQHPAFSQKEGTKFDIVDRHYRGHYDDFIWDCLIPNDFLEKESEGFLISNPKWISKIFKENYNFKKGLVYEIYKSPHNKKVIISHPFNCLRLKLIKKLFPNAKIILNIRNFKDYLFSCTDKWKTNKNFSKAFEEEKRPDIGLHWYIQNSIAIYHLKKYFKNNFYIFYHEKFYDENIDNQSLFDEITKFLDIENFNFDFQDVDLKFKFSKKIHFDYENFELIKRLVDEELK